jgi:hypothetical protein
MTMLPGFSLAHQAGIQRRHIDRGNGVAAILEAAITAAGNAAGGQERQADDHRASAHGGKFSAGRVLMGGLGHVSLNG